MRRFQNVTGIVDGWPLIGHQARQTSSHPLPFLSLIESPHQQIEESQGGRRSRLFMAATSPKTAGHFGVDASHRAKDKRTHRTHWPAAHGLDFLRVRCGCAFVKPPMFRVIPGLGADARRMRTEDGL